MKGSERVDRVIEGEARDQDPNRRPPKQLGEHHGGVPRRARTCLWPGPHQFGAGPPPSLGEHGTQKR